uniref:serine-rich adhesin for platelets-like isoform X2 n=1 Tax=Pristiophorus japonicus TaxID=55135 RepID=UPI00398E80AA
MEDIIVQQLFSTNNVSENDMEHPASKRVKLFSGPCNTIEESIEKNLSCANSKDLLKHRNEFTQQKGCFIDSNTEPKATDEKRNIGSSAIAPERYTNNEYGFENHSTNCEDHNLGITDLMVPLQMEKPIEKMKHKRSQGVLTPGVAESKASKTDILLLGYKTDVQDNKMPYSTTMKHEQIWDKIMISSGITITKDKRSQKDMCSKSVCHENKIDNLLNCESVKSDDNEASEICVESVKVCGPQDERREMCNIKHEEQECRQKTQLNSISVASTKNETVNHTEAVLVVPFTIKDTEIQKDTRTFNQTEAPAVDMGIDIKPVNVQSSYSLNSSSLNETAYEMDTQKMVDVPLKYTSSENSSGLFIEKIHAILENEKTAIVNMYYHGDNDITANKESTVINQIYNSGGTCIDVDETRKINNPLYVNKFIGTSGILNVKCNSVDASKEVVELIHEGISKSPDKKNQSVYGKQDEKAALIAQLQLPEEKQAELMQKVPEISNSKNRHIREITSSSENENLGSSQVEIKLEILEATSLTEKKYLEKDDEPVCDILQYLRSHSNAETDDFSTVPTVDLTSWDAIHSNNHECRSRCLLIDSSEAFEQKSQMISIYEPSENLNAYCVDSDKNGTSENEGEHELTCAPRPDFLLEKNNDSVPHYEDHYGNVLKIECADKIEQSSSFNSSSQDSVDLININDVSLLSHESSYATEIPASAFSAKSSAENSSGTTKIISENTDRQQSDSIVEWPQETGINISENEAECQPKYLSSPHYVKDRDCNFHTQSIIHYFDTDSTYRMQNDCTNKLQQFSTSSNSVTDRVQLSTNVNTLLLSQKPEILGEHHVSRMLSTTYNTENSTKEITICVSENTSIQTSVACNVIKNTEVNDFSIKEAECQLKSPNYLKSTDSDIHCAVVNVLQATLWLHGDKGQKSETECVNKVCSLTKDNLLSCTANMPPCHQNEGLREQQATSVVLSIENGTEETRIVFSENTDRHTFLEGSKKIEVNNISAREGVYQQKYVSKSSCVKHTNSDCHKGLDVLYGIPHFDTESRRGSQSEWSDKLAQSFILGMSTTEHSALSIPENAPHFNNGKEVLNEHHCSKMLSTTENSTDNEIIVGVSENGSLQTSVAYNMTKDTGTNNCSENKAECQFKYLTRPEWLKSTTSNVGSVAVNVLHPVPWLENDSGKMTEIRYANETVQFSSVCNLTKDNASLACTANILLYHQNKLLDEHCASTVVLSAENSSEATKIVFPENLGRQKPSLLSYTRTGLNYISKKEMECLQKYTSSCNYIKHSDNDLSAKVNMLHTVPHFDIENTHESQTDYSYKRAQFSFFSNSSKDTMALSSPVSTSPLSHENEILEEHQGGKMLSTVLDVENNIEENTTICSSTHANIQTPVTCNMMIEDTTVNDSSENYAEHVNDPSCLINGSDDVPTHLVNVFHETPQFEASNRHMAQMKCTDKTVRCSNICNLLKDCSGLNSTINTPQDCEMKEELEGCNSNETVAVTFSTDAAVNEKAAFTVSEIEGNKKSIMLVKEEESKQPGIKINSFSETISSYGSAFDNFEKITLNTDTEELDTVRLIGEINCCNKEMYNENESVTKQIIYDNIKSNKVWLSQMSSIKSSSVEGHQSNINNSAEETKSVIVREKDKKEYFHLRLPDMLQSRIKEVNNICYVQTSQPLVTNYKLGSAADQLQQHKVDHQQVYTESSRYENKEESKELSYDILNTVQNDLTSLHNTQKEELLQSLVHFSCADTVLVEMDQKGQKQKTSEKASTSVGLSVDPARILQGSSLTNDVPAVCRHNLEEDMKPLKPNFTPKQELKQVVSTTIKTQDPLPCQRKTMYDSYTKESSEYETSTCLMSQDSSDHQIERPDSTIGHQRNDSLEQINSATGSTVLNVDVRQSKKQFIHSKNNIANFEMKEQFNAVLEELRLFHEISRQSEWSDSVSEENVTEIVNNTKDLNELPGRLDKMNNLHMLLMHDDLQHSILPHGKDALSQKDHDHLIGQDALQHTCPVFAKKVSVIKGEQEVPMAIDVSETEREESMYTPHEVSEQDSQESREAKTWSSAFNFQINYEKTVADSIQSKTGNN